VNPVNTLILLDSDDPTAELFRNAIERNTDLTGKVQLQFASANTAADIISDVEIATCGGLSPDLITRAEKLKWIAYWSAGLDGKITRQINERNLLLTNASGVHGPNIAEHLLAYMLMFTRRMENHLRSQINRVWERKMPFERPPAAELSGQTLGIVGLGRIGEALVVRARAFGMRVIGVKRDPSTRYDYSEDSTPDALYGMDGLQDLLRESDHVCIALPHTADTHHLFNAQTIPLMKPTAYLYNVARGSIIDEDALIAALRDGQIAGAGLDVFEQEPLPQTSELWAMPNVIITPHVAGLTPHYFERFAKQFADNLGRYLRGDTLNNLYDPARGY